MEVALEVDSHNVSAPSPGIKQNLEVDESPACRPCMHKIRLIFNERQVEDGFVVSRAKLLLHNIRICMAACALLMGGAIARDTSHCNPYDERHPKENVAVREFCFGWVWGVLVLAVVFFFTSPWVWSLKTKCFRGEFIGEYICTFLSAVAVWFPILWSHKHSAWLYDKETNEVWGSHIAPDHRLEVASLLYLFCIVALINVAIPIRTCFLWIVEASAVVAYSIVYPYYNPYRVSDVFDAFAFASTCLVLFLGRWATEKQERSDYLKILEEKSLRFVAEHALAPALHLVPEEASHSHSELDDSFLYSTDGSSVQTPHHPQAVCLHAVYVAQEVQTDLNWIADGGFKCRRCSRPPKAISLEDERESVWAAVQKHGKSSKVSRLQREQRASSPSSSSSEEGSSRSLQLNQQSHAAASPRSSSRSGGSRSSDLQHASGPPQVPFFCLTPVETKQAMIMEVLTTWNCSLGGPHDCCPFHIAVRDACQVIHGLQRHACKPQWIPLIAGQCGVCGAMSGSEGATDESGAPECEFCGATVTSVSDLDDAAVQTYHGMLEASYEEEPPCMDACISSKSSSRTIGL